ncbi:MAG: type II 3-dehydroquinate dehydratase, partial [Candidatus Saccharibacteria bacterium]
MKRILVINGPNLNLLGSREKDLYGSVTLNDIENKMLDRVKNMEVLLDFFQSNHEGEIIDKIHAARGSTDFIIINAGGLTHYSVSLHDALKAAAIPAVEVHMTNIYQREEFRHHSLVSPAAVGGVFGFGEQSYYLAMDAALKIMGIE